MVDLYKSKFEILPFIGKIPRFTLGDRLTVKSITIKPSDHPDFFDKLKWYEGRELDVKTVMCIKETWSGSYCINKDEIYIVDKTDFCDEILNKKHLIWLEEYEEPCSAEFFVPVVYNIITDEVTARIKQKNDMLDSNNPYLHSA